MRKPMNPIYKDYSSIPEQIGFLERSIEANNLKIEELVTSNDYFQESLDYYLSQGDCAEDVEFIINSMQEQNTEVAALQDEIHSLERKLEEIRSRIFD